jgi:CubicO group peptidase (beta-lactamase class C family)
MSLIQHLPHLDRLARDLVVAPGVAPCASVAVALRGAPGWECFVGAAGRHSARDTRPITPALVFDLASVSKPFLALTLARLARRRRIGWRDRLDAHLEEASGTATAAAPLELLLAHRAGLLPHLELFAPVRERKAMHRATALREAASARRAECKGPLPPDGFPPVYSDLGYILVGEAISRAAGIGLDEIVRREVCEPLHLSVRSARQWLAEDPDFTRHVAPTEHTTWRGGELVGVAHDDNAWALAGHGLAGHAGLFADCTAVTQMGAAVLDAQDGHLASWLSPGALEPVLRQRAGGTLRAGFDGTSGPDSAAGRSCGGRTFGHLGFTGTSVWCDPDAKTVSVLLTNRVNPSRHHAAIRGARPRVHDALHAVAAEARRRPADMA